MAYTESIVIRSCDLDMYGRWRPSAILEAMQTVAGAHCDAIGLDRSVTSGFGVVWVLSRIRVELEALPANGETVTLETCALTPRHLFYPRAYVFTGASGRVLGWAHSFWLLMDYRERRAAAVPEITARLPIESPSVRVLPARTVVPLESEGIAVDFTPAFTDFDLNGHVNNAKYMDWCWNALGFEGLREREIAAFDVNYDREVLPSETVSAELRTQGDAFSFIARAGGARCFGARGELRRVEGPKGVI